MILERLEINGRSAWSTYSTFKDEVTEKDLIIERNIAVERNGGQERKKETVT